MAILKYEMRQLRAYTVWWSVCMAAFIFLMLPAYVDMISSGTMDLSSMGSSGVFEAFGVDMAILSTPVGMFGWLTTFFALAGGVNGMFLGLRTFTKETVDKSAEFLYTKPFKRGAVFCAKVSAGLISAIIAGAFYCLGAAASAAANLKGEVNFRTFTLIALSFLLIEIFFVLFGALLGAVHSKIRTPLLVSAGVVFVFFVLSAFAIKVHADAIKFFTPFAYFGTSGIVNSGAYNTWYIAAFVILCVIFWTAGYFTFIKKDVSFIA